MTSLPSRTTRPSFGVAHARDDVEQRGLARAVRADDARAPRPSLASRLTSLERGDATEPHGDARRGGAWWTRPVCRALPGRRSSWCRRSPSSRHPRSRWSIQRREASRSRLGILLVRRPRSPWDTPGCSLETLPSAGNAATYGKPLRRRVRRRPGARSSHDHAHRHRRRRSDDQLPEGRRREDLRLPARRRTHAEDAATDGVPRRVHVQGRAQPARARATTASTVTIAEMDKWGVDIGLVGVGREATSGALKDHPDRFVGSLEIDPNDITGTVRKIRAAHDGVRHQGGDHVPRRVQPAGAGERPALLPDLPDVHRPRHPDHRRTPASPARASRRRARTSCTSTRSATTSPSCAS